MDLTPTIAPKSDQLNAEDLLTGPRTFTIQTVTAGSSDQPVNVHLVEIPGRPYRPSKSMRRLMVAAWGAEADAYRGRRITLYRNPEVKFGGIAVGGIEISHLSDIDHPLTVALLVTRGKRKNYTVNPIPAAPAGRASAEVDWYAEVDAAGGDIDALRAIYGRANNAGADTATLEFIRQAGIDAKATQAANTLTGELIDDPEHQP